MEWLAAVPPQLLLTGVGVAVLVVATCLVVAIMQGRELSFWPPKLGARPAPPPGGERPVAAPRDRMSGCWKHTWGTLVLERQGNRAKGVLLDLNGKSFLLDGIVDGDRFDFGWTRYSDRNVVAQGKGRLDVTGGGRSLDMKWQDAEGIFIASSAERDRWLAVEP